MKRKEKRKTTGVRRFDVFSCFGRYKNNHIDKAIEFYSEALNHDPTNVLLYTNKAAALMEKKGKKRKKKKKNVGAIIVLL